jgi:hypothetical protein
MCGVAVVNHAARVPKAAFRTNEYLDFRIKDRIVRLDQFEPQLAIAALTAHGRRRLNQVAQMRPPFVRHAS